MNGKRARMIRWAIDKAMTEKIGHPIPRANPLWRKNYLFAKRQWRGLSSPERRARALLLERYLAAPPR